jgi:hypothetical protein
MRAEQRNALLLARVVALDIADRLWTEVERTLHPSRRGSAKWTERRVQAQAHYDDQMRYVAMLDKAIDSGRIEAPTRAGAARLALGAARSAERTGGIPTASEAAS